mgnify:CR=1 FL=1
MLSNSERDFIYSRAYIPEHLTDYVEAVSMAEAHLDDDYVYYTRGNHLIFIGYPLHKEKGDISRSYESACKRHSPATVSVISPRNLLMDEEYERNEEDVYYRLKLPIESIPQEISYMIRRATREVIIREGTFCPEHGKLVRDFIRTHNITAEYEAIFTRLEPYCAKSVHARLLEARNGDNTLSAFTIFDLGSSDHAFYLFNFRSPRHSVPGVSDLLFYEMVRISSEEGKGYLNLGLGINSGNRRFKEKWGAAVFFPHKSVTIFRKPPALDSLFGKL